MVFSYLAYKLLIEPTTELSTQILKKIRDLAYLEVYDPEKIKAALEENKLLYEAEEITKEDYEKINSELSKRLEITKSLEKPLKEIKTLYESGKITKEKYERRRSEIIDEFDRTLQLKKKGTKKGKKPRYRIRR